VASVIRTKGLGVDNWTARTYMQELVNQAEAAQLAAEDLNAALRSTGPGTSPRAFAAVQSLLAAGAMVSKMLWPQPSAARVDGTPLSETEESQRRTTLARGKFLRLALGIKGIPALESRRYARL
jgi:hypothetical protein